MKEIVLIQLISAQAVPNLLAAMALNPQQIIHCCTPSMRIRSEHLAKAYKAAGLSANITIEHLSPMPQAPEMKSLITHLVRTRSGQIVLNFTGGTKLMSLGAFAGAMLRKIPSLYVDTDDDIFVNGHSGPGFNDLFEGGDTSFGQVKRRLNVHTLAIANGCGRATSGSEWKVLAPLADLLLRDPDLEAVCHNTVDRFLRQIPQDYRQAVDFWKQQLESPIDLPEAVLEPGTAGGLFDKRGAAFFIHPVHAGKLRALNSEDLSRPWICRPALETLKKPFSWFQGVWWEVAVMQHLSAQGLYRDLRWSVQVGDRNQMSTDMEEDILGIDNVNLLYVSCKRGGHRSGLSRLLEEIHASAERIGGSYSRKILAVCYFPETEHGKRIRKRADDLGIKTVTRKDILNGG